MKLLDFLGQALSVIVIIGLFCALCGGFWTFLDLTDKLYYNFKQTQQEPR